MLARFYSATSLLVALGGFTTGCATENYQAPVQPSVQGRASLMANPPSEPVPFSQEAPPPAPAAAAPVAPPPRAPQTTASNQVGPLPALPSQAPMYTPAEPPPPAVVYTQPVYV